MSKNEQQPVPGADTWRQTQEKLRACSKEEEVLLLLKAEEEGPNRARWINRIRGRYKVLRNERLNKALEKTTPQIEE